MQYSYNQLWWSDVQVNVDTWENCQSFGSPFPVSDIIYSVNRL